MVEAIAVDRGDVYVCTQCGKHFVLWNARNLTVKTLLAIFSAWFGLLLLGTGLFALTVLLGLPALFGFDRDIGDATGAFALAVIVGFGGAFLAFRAYLPDVIRQWVLRSHLSGRLKD
ncbi:MAG: hypothetical protein AB7G39_14460 [Alphaproteobacteria bacterium]